MLKKTVTYVDYNNNEQSEDLYFNLTKTELTDLIDIIPRLEAMQERMQAGVGDLSSADTKEFLNIIKLFVKASYGVRSEDGRRFQKNDELWREFEQSAAYDAFVFDLFIGDGSAANEFMSEIFPKDLTDGSALKKAGITASLPEPEEDTRPAYIRENRDPTRSELDRMSKDELQEAFRRKSQGN